MKLQKDEKWLDSALARVIGSGKPQFDAERWKEQYLKEELRRKKTAKTTPNAWRILMKSRITKIATAAVIIIAAVLSISVLDNFVKPAYAIEQTIKVNNKINSFHFKYYSSLQDPNYGLKKEAWVKYDESGNISNVRVNYSWPKQDDMVQIWKDGKAQQWTKESNRIIYINDKDFSDKVLYFGQRYNPRGAIQYLYERQANREIIIEIEEPSDKTKPIAITANYPPNTYLLGKDIPTMREIFFVDQNTKLITAVEIYELKNDEYVECGIWRYYDYNKPFDEAIFTIENELPDDVVEFYHYGVEDAGLEQGDLDEKQIATKLLREFLKALIDKDYAKAGHLFGGMPAHEAEEKFGNLNVVQIISIDEPVLSENPRGYRISCSVELNRDGQIVEWQPKGPFIRQVDGNPHRWIIVSGI